MLNFSVSILSVCVGMLSKSGICSFCSMNVQKKTDTECGRLFLMY